VKALDTNIIVRFLTRDDVAQHAAVIRRFAQAKEVGEQFHVAAPVWTEAVWVLTRNYGIGREALLAALEAFSQLPVLDSASAEFLRHCLATAKTSRLELPDLIVGMAARDAGCEATLSFDKAAAKSDLFEIL
jgi:predicted nucleic-acid-binding protein